MRSPSLGIITILLAGAVACAPATTSTAAGSRQTRSPNEISQLEIRDAGAGAGNAYDLITRLRPQWLRNSSMGTMSGGVAAMQGLIVYLDNVKLGDVGTLRTVAASGITSVWFLTPERAASTLPDIGREPISGAIVISTR